MLHSQRWLGRSVITTAWGQTSLPAPTPGEARIRKALDETTEFDFKEQPLANVLAHVRQHHHIQVRADEKALADSIGSDAPITFSVRDISLRSALRLLLRELDLTYLVRDGWLLITSNTEAENLIAARIYLVGDLLTIDGKPASRQESDYGTLESLIMSTVAPTTWDVGNQGFSSFHPGRALIIPQSDEVHEEIEELFSALRAARDKQFKLAERPQVPEPENDDDDVTTRIYRLNAPATWGTWMGLGGFGLNERSGILAQMGGMGMGSIGMPADAKQLDTWATELADLLPQIVEPKSWERNGGSGVVHPFAGLSIVKQTGAVHCEVAKLLRDLVLGSHIPPRSDVPDNEVLMITSKTEAENMLTTKVYPVLDLATAAADVRSAPRFDYPSLVEIIRANVVANSWDEFGGPGSIVEYPNCGALVASQTAAGHEQVQRLLRSLREARHLAEQSD